MRNPNEKGLIRTQNKRVNGSGMHTDAHPCSSGYELLDIHHLANGADFLNICSDMIIIQHTHAHAHAYAHAQAHAHGHALMHITHSCTCTRTRKIPK